MSSQELGNLKIDKVLKKTTETVGVAIVGVYFYRVTRLSFKDFFTSL